MNLAEWARIQGIHPQSAYSWFKRETLPVPAIRLNSRSILLDPGAATIKVAEGLVWNSLSSPPYRLRNSRFRARRAKGPSHQ